MKAKGLKIEVLENDKVIGTLTTKQFQEYMGRPRAFLADLIKDFNLQDRGTVVRSAIDYK